MILTLVMVSYVLKEKRAIPKLGDALAKTS
jgi:hypothetical protein